MAGEVTVQKNGFDLKPLPKDLEAEEEKDDRGKWDNQVEFLLSCLGYAVGYGNVWRFPFLCYKNGGAVFLIPYGLMLIISGFPLFFMELALGQYFSLGPNILFGKLALVFKGVGYCMVLISILITIYFNVIFAWSLFYLFASFSSVLPWSTCDNDFNSPTCYTKGDNVKCLVDGLLFYNKSCIAPEVFCGLANLGSLNSSYCVESNATSSDLVPVDTLFPRISSAEDYYRNRMLGVTDRTWSDMGSVRWEIVGCLALAWFMIFICMVKGVKSSGKVVYVTATAPYVVLTALLIRGSTLTGAYNGVEFYFLKANFTKLTEIEVWNDAATQIFYSLGVAAGVLITLSSYNPFKNNCLRDAVTIAFSNCLTSIFAGFAIFSILGFMANELQIDVKDVVESGSGLAFIAYPEAVTKMPFSNIWAVLFFVMLVSLGISSQFSYLETIVTAIFDRFPTLRPKKAQLTALIVVILFLCGVPMCLDGGVYMFELFVWYSAGISLIIAALSEVLVVTYGYGFDTVMHHITKEMEVSMPWFMYWYFYFMWRFITPGALSVILLLSIYYYLPAYYGSYTFPPSIQGLGWLICVTSVICIPLGAIWALRRTGRNWREAFKSNIKSAKRSTTEEDIATSQNTFRYAFDNTIYEGEKL